MTGPPRRTRSVAGQPVAWLEAGVGPPLVLVHGAGGSAELWPRQLDALADVAQVLAPDLPGHGPLGGRGRPSIAAYAEWLDAFLAAVTEEPAVLVGHSMGGAVALTYAALHPGRLARLVIVDTTLHMTPDRIAKLREVGTRPGRTYATREEFVSRFRLRPADSSALPEVLRHLANQAAQKNSDGTWGHKFDRDVYAVRESVDGLPHWNHIKVPALLVKGGRSARITRKSSPKCRRARRRSNSPKSRAPITT